MAYQSSVDFDWQFDSQNPIGLLRTWSPSTKDPIHMKRSGSKKHPNVGFNLGMIVPSSKDAIFHNALNKQRFIMFLGNELEKRGCSVHHSNGDADTLIVTATLKSAETKPTVLIGDDTDLLVLLLAHADLSHEPVFFAPEPKKRQKSSLEYGTFIF